MKQLPKLGPRKSWSGEASGPPTAHAPRASLDAKDDGVGAVSAAPPAPASASAGGHEGSKSGTGTNGEDSPPPPPQDGDVGDGGGSASAAKSGKGSRGGGGVPRGDGQAAGGGGTGVDARDWSALPTEFMAADLSKIFRASQEKVEETLTAGCFYR